MRITLYTQQAIAKRCEQLILEKDSITQVVGEMKSDNYQYRIQDNHSDTFEDAPLPPVRAACRDSFGNRTCCSAYHITSSCLLPFRGLIKKFLLIGYL